MFSVTELYATVHIHSMVQMLISLWMLNVELNVGKLLFLHTWIIVSGNTTISY